MSLGRRLGLVLMTTMLSGCTARGDRTAAPPASLQVHFAGCYAVTRGPVCHLTASERKLAFWWPTSEGRWRSLATSAGPVQVIEESVREGGRFLRVQVPAGATWLALTVDEDGRQWRLRLGDRQGEPLVERASRLRNQGKLAEAIALLQSEARVTASADRRMLLERSLARLWMDEGRNDEAIVVLSSSSEKLYAAGELSLAIKDAFVLSILLLDRKQEYQQALDVLERATAWAREVPELIPSLRINAGGVGMETGDLRAALASFQDGYRSAFRLGVDGEARAARRYLAVVLKRLGREREALVIQREALVSPPSSGCERSDDLVNLALNVLAMSRHPVCGGRSDSLPEDPGALLVRAEAALSTCPDQERLRNVLLERWLHAVEHGEVGEHKSIRDRLASLSGEGSPLLQVWREEAEARTMLVRGRAREAAAGFARQSRLAQELGLGEERLRAAIGVGQALEAAGDQRGAVGAYRRAETVLEELVGQVPLGEGQHAFARSHRQSAEQLVLALLRLGLRAEALGAARAAHVRATIRAAHAQRVAELTGERRTRWQTTVARYQHLRSELESASRQWGVTSAEFRARRADTEDRTRVILDEAFRLLNEGAPRGPRAPRRPEPGELIITYFPTVERVVGFAQWGDELKVSSIPGSLCDDRAARPPGEVLLSAFEPQLAAARRVTLVAPPELWSLDLHAVPWRGHPLTFRRPVSYSLDLCTSGQGCRLIAARAPGRARALVVADPRFDLREAQLEAALVARTLEHANYDVDVVTGRAATHQRVSSLLSRAAVFHYAGHALGVGTEGFGSMLPLADETRLYLGDVLALRQAPARVVLSACEGARVAAAEGGLSLAHAFVAAGSTSVIAATRTVDDRASRAFVEAVAAAGYYDVAADPAEALARAQRGLDERAPITDWAAFRLLTP